MAVGLAVAHVFPDPINRAIEFAVAVSERPRAEVLEVDELVFESLPGRGAVAGMVVTGDSINHVFIGFIQSDGTTLASAGAPADDAHTAHCFSPGEA